MLLEWFEVDLDCFVLMVVYCFNEYFFYEVIRVLDEYGEMMMLECWENLVLLKKFVLFGY